jgi:glycosyltransferase involved in cell wall biosynthesis
MRVVIDAVPLLVRSAGVKNYLYYWIKHLREAAGSDTIGTFPPIKKLRPLTHQRSVAGWWSTFSSLASLALANHAGIALGGKSVREADIFHTSSLLWNPPQHKRLTTTVHDMTCWLMPELQSEANRRADRNFAEVLKRADALIAVSQSTKNDSVRVLGLPPEKITVIHSGVSDAFFDVRTDEIWRIKKKYRLKRPFVLFTGTIEPRKNIDSLLDAYTSLESPLRKEFDLVIAGPIGWAADKTISRLKSIRYLGYIPERDLATLTSAASVFVYPSLYEGFGFPVAQAMAAGVPVITSNNSSLPEVTGNAAVLIDPRSTSELRNALTRLLQSPEQRAQLSELGAAQAREFRWDVCAAKSLRFFESVL